MVTKGHTYLNKRAPFTWVLGYQEYWGHWRYMGYWEYQVYWAPGQADASVIAGVDN